MLWESSKNQFGRPKKKKKVVKILENFLKIRPPPPPRENPRSAPAPGDYELSKFAKLAILKTSNCIKITQVKNRMLNELETRISFR